MVSALRGLNTGQESVCVSDFKPVTIAGLPEGIRLYFPFLVVNTPCLCPQRETDWPEKTILKKMHKKKGDRRSGRGEDEEKKG